MASFLVEEITKIAMAMVAGAVLSAIYDILRIFRKIFTHNTVAYSTEDLLYFICMAPVVFVFVLVVNDGIFRFYIVLGILLGVFVHRNTVSRLVVNFWLKKIINNIKIRAGKQQEKKRRGQREK